MTSCALQAGMIEESRALGWLSAPRWRWALPVLTIAAGLALGVHGGTHQHLPRLVEQAHHWIMSAGPGDGRRGSWVRDQSGAGPSWLAAGATDAVGHGPGPGALL